MTDRALQYAKKTVKENSMGKLHVLSCQRFLKDLERQGSKEFPFVWKPELSERVLNFAESLIISEGAEKKRLVLFPHQCFDIGNLFGWVHRETGFRRFRRNYISMARQNGKSFENGILGTYISGFSGYHNGRLFTAATKKRQSKLVWDEMAKFIRADQDLNERFRIQDWKSTITSLDTGNTIEALSKEGGLDEGFRSIFVSLDELHQMRDNSIYSSLYRGTRALDETLVSMITTRGKDLNSYAYEMDTYCVNILQGFVEAEDFFVDIYAMDEGDKIFSQKTMKKANPFLFQSKKGKESLIQDAKTAKDMGGRELSEFVTKSLNYWYRNASNDYIDFDAWKKCEGEMEIEGAECYVGIDLSSGGDLTSLGFNFETEEGIDFFTTHSFMPRGRYLEHIKTDLAPYDVWEKKGLITLTGGENSFITDYLYIIDYLKDFIKEKNIRIKGIAYDAHNISSLLPYLDDFGVPLMEIKQSARELNDATQNIRLNTKSGKLIHDINDEILSYSMANAKIVTNSFGEMKIDKKDGKRVRRIDPVDAIVDAHAMKLKQRPKVDINKIILSDDWSL